MTYLREEIPTQKWQRRSDASLLMIAFDSLQKMTSIPPSAKKLISKKKKIIRHL